MNSSSSRTPHLDMAHELQHAYDFFNRELFDQSLPHCMITLQRERDTCGYFSAERFGNNDGLQVDEIALNPSFFAVVPILETLQTLVHEMVHVWQHHHGEPGRGRYHNAQWANKMESIGLMPTDTGKPGGKRTGDRIADYVIKGGPFLRAAEKLLTAAYKISWHDRFPPASAFVGMGSLPSAELSASLGFPSAAIVASPAVQADVGARVSEHAAAAASGATASNKSNRLKYSCQCTPVNNFWGKSGIKATCDLCEQAFAEA